MTAKWIGYIIRRKFELKTQKCHGVFTIVLSEKPQLERLYEKYGLASEDGADPGAAEQPSGAIPVEHGDFGDIGNVFEG